MTQTQAVKTVAGATPIVIRGQSGVGKTWLANTVVQALRRCEGLNVFQINADVVRQSLNADLSFSLEDRVENARRMGAMTKLIQGNGAIAVVDFIMPTQATYKAFADAFGGKFYLYTLEAPSSFSSRYEDTGKLFEHLPEATSVVPFTEYTLPEAVKFILEQHADF